MNDEQLLRDLDSLAEGHQRRPSRRRADHGAGDDRGAMGPPARPLVAAARSRWPGGPEVPEAATDRVDAPDGKPACARAPDGKPLRASGPTVFSALRFVAAGVIVGLFGGFLLAGVLTTQPPDKVPAAVTEPPSPMTTDELLSRSRTEEVEPGILRVIDDGVRDLRSAGNTASSADGTAASGCWRRMASCDSAPTRHTTGLQGRPEPASDFGVAPDGTVWTVRAEDASRPSGRSTTGGGRHRPDVGYPHPRGHLGRHGLGSLAGPGVGDGQPSATSPATAGSPSGKGTGSNCTTVASTCPMGATSGSPEARRTEHLPELFGLVDGAWQRSSTAPSPWRAWGRRARSGSSPATSCFAWTRPRRNRCGGMGAARVDDRREGAACRTFLPGDAFRVAPDGSVWFALRAKSGPPLLEESCEGIARFDGTNRVGPSLSDLCVTSIEVAADGSVWLLAHDREADDDLAGLYVIDPGRRSDQAVVAAAAALRWRCRTQYETLEVGMAGHRPGPRPGGRTRWTGKLIRCDLAGRSLEETGPTGDGEGAPALADIAGFGDIGDAVAAPMGGQGVTALAGEGRDDVLDGGGVSLGT